MVEAKRVRPERRSIGTGDVLSFDKRPGFVRRVVNDIDGRVERFIEAGYTPVESNTADTSDARVGKPSQMGAVVRKSVGGGRHAVLMEIPEEWFIEDQAAKQQKVNEIEDSLQPNQAEGQYGQISINR